MYGVDGLLTPPRDLVLMSGLHYGFGNLMCYEYVLPGNDILDHCLV